MLHTNLTSHFKTLAIISILLPQLFPLIPASSSTQNGTSKPSKPRDFHDPPRRDASRRHTSSSQDGFAGGIPIFFWIIFGAIIVITCISVICGFATRGRCGGGGYGPGYGGGMGMGGMGMGMGMGMGYHHHHDTGCGGGGYHHHHHHGGCGGGGFSSHHHSGCMCYLLSRNVKYE